MDNRFPYYFFASITVMIPQTLCISILRIILFPPLFHSTFLACVIPLSCRCDQYLVILLSFFGFSVLV